MSFDRNNLERLGGGVAGANGCWIYSTDDAIDAVEASGYFDEAKRELKEKDYIIAMDLSSFTDRAFCSAYTCNACAPYWNRPAI